MDKQEVVDLILQEREVTFKTKSMVIIDGSEIRKSDFHDAIPELIPEDWIKDYYFEYKTEKDRKNFASEIFSALEKELKGVIARKYIVDDIPESKSPVTYIPVINIRDNEKVLVNPNTKEISEVCYDAWVSTLPREERGIVQAQSRLAVFAYDPYDLSTLVMTTFEDYNLLKVNTYIPPVWRLLESTNEEVCPEPIAQVIEHLFPNPEAQIYIYDWLFHTLISRNEAYLVLNGAKGIGKGVFCSIVKALVGLENYTEAPDSFLESQFNATLDKKRAIVLDEFRVDKPKHTKLKRYINKYQNIEKKGKDADRAVETFNNFIISNNDETDMYLEYDDRRFSCVDLTQENLLETMTEEAVKELIAALENAEHTMVREFGYFIYNRGAVKYGVFSVFKGDKYHKLVQSSLKNWQKFILEQILKTTTDSLSITRLGNQAKAKDGRSFFPSNPQKVEDFLNNYRYGGEKRLGKVVGDYIEIDEEFLADKLIEMDEEEGDLL